MTTGCEQSHGFQTKKQALPSQPGEPPKLLQLSPPEFTQPEPEIDKETRCSKVDTLARHKQAC